MGRPRLGVYMYMLQRSINVFSGFSFGKLSVRIR
jgi:hypothetical protein